MTVIWEDPPAPTNRARGWRLPVIDELKKHPGRWAKVHEETHVASLFQWHKRGCEAVNRNHRVNADGKVRVDVYARWPEATS